MVQVVVAAVVQVAAVVVVVATVVQVVVVVASKSLNASTIVPAQVAELTNQGRNYLRS